MKTVLFLDSVHPILSERLIRSGLFSCVHAEDWSTELIQEALKTAHGIVVRSRFPMNSDFLKDASCLEFIARSGAGLENIDEFYCQQNGIALFNAPEGNRNAVGEHALGMLLAMLNKMATANRDIRSGIWDRDGNRGIELDGKTVGIIGYGNNGSAFAQKLRGFDVKVLAYDKYKSGFGSDFVMEATLSAVLSQSDVISFHIPQNSETIHFANQEFFDALQKPIFLLNLSRGKIVETEALLRAIDSKVVLGAGLDVNEFEKASFESFFEHAMPELLNRLIQSDQVLLTPHVAGWTTESYEKLSSVLADKIFTHYSEEK